MFEQGRATLDAPSGNNKVIVFASSPPLPTQDYHTTDASKLPCTHGVGYIALLGPDAGTVDGLG
jgi:hypothetical protein